MALGQLLLEGGIMALGKLLLEGGPYGYGPIASQGRSIWPSVKYFDD